MSSCSSCPTGSALSASLSSFSSCSARAAAAPAVLPPLPAFAPAKPTLPLRAILNPLPSLSFAGDPSPSADEALGLLLAAADAEAGCFLSSSAAAAAAASAAAFLLRGVPLLGLTGGWPLDAPVPVPVVEGRLPAPVPEPFEAEDGAGLTTDEVLDEEGDILAEDREGGVPRVVREGEDEGDETRGRVLARKEAVGVESPPPVEEGWVRVRAGLAVALAVVLMMVGEGEASLGAGEGEGDPSRSVVTSISGSGNPCSNCGGL